jgi:hypothetical protein
MLALDHFVKLFLSKITTMVFVFSSGVAQVVVERKVYSSGPNRPYSTTQALGVRPGLGWPGLGGLGLAPP